MDFCWIEGSITPKMLKKVREMLKLLVIYASWKSCQTLPSRFQLNDCGKSRQSEKNE